NISIQSVEVIATGEFGAEGEPGSNFQYKAEVRSDASQSEIKELINYVNEIAEIHKTLRNGINVNLV
ncbi:MAG: OsmC family protein, partial [Bacteroidota bacterium]